MTPKDFPAILLEVLALNASAAEKKQILLKQSELEQDRDYIETFDLHMIETASILLRRWGEPKGQ